MEKGNAFSPSKEDTLDTAECCSEDSEADALGTKDVPTPDEVPQKTNKLQDSYIKKMLMEDYDYGNVDDKVHQFIPKSDDSEADTVQYDAVKAQIPSKEDTRHCRMLQ